MVTRNVHGVPLKKNNGEGLRNVSELLKTEMGFGPAIEIEKLVWCSCEVKAFS